MGLFKFRKKKDFVDLTERYKKQQEKIAQTQSEKDTDPQSPQSAFSFLGNLASSSGSEKKSNGYIDVSDVEEKRKKLAKRLMDITAKIEDLSNQIYHLQQRIEVLERKSGVGNY